VKDEFKNPWQKLSSRMVYQNPWFSLREDKVLNPSGKSGIYSVIEPKKAVGVLAVNEAGNIILIGQYRYPTECYSWEIIAGGSEANESVLDTAKRELQEEAGYKASVWRPLSREIHLSNCFTNERAHLYLATELHAVTATPDETEELKVKELELRTIIEMIEEGIIVDAMTIIAIYRYQASLT
jgi:ADP-ribose pyrophosphatase